MGYRGTDSARLFVGLAAAALFAASWPSGARGAEPEVIKGTVASIRPSAIYLTDVGGNGDGSPTRDAMAAIDNNTEYFDAARRVTHEEIVPGLKVIVRFREAGEGRTAAQVRIIGGKAP